tara:strand:+ start:43 stop:252 length:210 start_codon:yes stop_codon:yes gene_type:complete
MNKKKPKEITKVIDDVDIIDLKLKLIDEKAERRSKDVLLQLENFKTMVIILCAINLFIGLIFYVVLVGP